MSDVAPTYQVLINGAELGQEDLNSLKEIRIANYMRLPDVCVISAAYADPDKLDATPFAVGSSIEVKVGASADPSDTPKTVFWGTIATLEPGFGAGGVSLSVRAFDRAHALMNGRKSRAFQNMTLSDVFSKLVSEAGLSGQASDSRLVYEYLQQDNETDWDFLWRLADREGLEFVAQNRQAIMRKPGTGDTVELEWKKTLREFTPRVTSVQQPRNVTVRGYDRQTKSQFVATADSPSANGDVGLTRDDMQPTGTIFVATEAISAQDEGLALAQAVLDKVARAYASAEGIAFGNPDIKAGCSIKVSGIGEKFGGTYRVGHVEHILKGSGFETHFGSTPPTVLSTIGGGNGSGPPPWPTQLVVGLVTNNNDPDQQGRVRVKYPSLDESLEGAWARVALPNAGASNRGLMMAPQVGDEVLIGFLNGDSRVPYVLGSLFNGVDTPDPDMLQDIDKQDSFVVNTLGRAIVKSKGDMILTTSGGAAASQGPDGKLTITVADEVKQTSQKDWTVETQGGASHKATKDYAIKAQQNFNAEGMSVSVKANQSVSIEGMAGVEIKCGGSSVKVDMSGVTISGPLIRIG